MACGLGDSNTRRDSVLLLGDTLTLRHIVQLRHGGREYSEEREGETLRHKSLQIGFTISIYNLC